MIVLNPNGASAGAKRLAESQNSGASAGVRPACRKKCMPTSQRLAAALLIAFVCFIGCQRQDVLKTGDLVFVGIPLDYSLDSTSMGSAIASSTGRLDELNIIHVAIAEVDEDGTWIIDATIKHGVDRYPLDTFLTDFTLKDGSLPVFEVMRLKDYDGLADEAVANAKGFVGLPYDTHFLPGNAAMYCSELVQESYLDNKGMRIFPSEPMNFKDENGEFPLYWTQLFALLGEPVPQDVPGTNPKAMSAFPRLRKVDVCLTDTKK